MTHSHDSRDVQNGKGCEWTRNDAKELTACVFQCVSRVPNFRVPDYFRIWYFTLYAYASTVVRRRIVGHILLVESEVHDGADVDDAVVVRGELVEVVEVVEHDVVLHPPVP